MKKLPSISVSPAKRPRNGFDCSETHLYSQPAGMLLPVYTKFLQPHDHLRVDITSIVQAQTLKGRPFLGLKQNFAAYFVPCRTLWSYSDSFFSGLKAGNTLSSSALGTTGVGGTSSGIDEDMPFRMPSFNGVDIFCKFAGLPNFKSSDGTYKALMSDGNVKPVSSNDFFKYPQSFDVLGYPTYLGYSRLYDMLGYGSFPYVSGKLTTDITSLDTSHSFFRFNGLPFLAYQKIYQDHFLDTSYERPDRYSYNCDDCFSGKSVSKGNEFRLDYYMNLTNERLPLDRVNRFFQPRYVKWHKDLLSNIHPSPLFLSDVTGYISAFYGSGSQLNPDGTNRNLGGFDINKGPNDIDATKFDTIDENNNLTAASLRNLFALDKMNQISSRAPKNYRAQIKAHYGTDVYSDQNTSMYLGGFQKTLEVSPVIASSDGNARESGPAETGDILSSTYFGQQGSYIDSSSNGRVEFDCKDFGYFMVVSWFSPESFYDSYGVNPFNLKFAREDFFIPEFENLGMQPIYNINLLPSWSNINFKVPYDSADSGDVDAVTGVSTEFWSKDRTIDPNAVYGWQPRYSEYKSGANYVHGEFKSGHSLSSLVVKHSTLFNSSSKRSDFSLNVNNSNIASQSVRKDYGLMPTSFLFVDPAVLNNVVEVGYDGHEDTDPFRIMTLFDVSYISDMSVSGLPRL